MKPYFIGICGGTASGKSTLCREIAENLSVIDDFILLPMDNFYKGLTDEEHDNAENYNFDHPDAIDFDSVFHVLEKLLNHEDADIPNYDFATHKRTPEKTHLEKSYFILFEGILALHDERIRDMMDLKLFVHEADDVRLARRIRRDIAERGRDVIGVLKQWHGTVKPSFDEFVFPTMKHADLIVQGNETNKTAIEFIVDNLTEKMKSMGIAKKQIEFEENLQKSSKKHFKHANTILCFLIFSILIKPMLNVAKIIISLTNKHLKTFYRHSSPHQSENGGVNVQFHCQETY